MGSQTEIIEGARMKTLTTLRSILRIAVGCLLCLAVAGLGFYPFAGNDTAADRSGDEGRNGGPIRRGLAALIA
jgi:hypothetical protein